MATTEVVSLQLLLQLLLLLASSGREDKAMMFFVDQADWHDRTDHLFLVTKCVCSLFFTPTVDGTVCKTSVVACCQSRPAGTYRGVS